MYKYKYIALLDIDEAIVPLGKLAKWSKLMEIVELEGLKEKNESKASYSFQNINFVDEMTNYRLKYRDHKELEGIPNFLHILRNVYRDARHSTGVDMKMVFSLYYIVKSNDAPILPLSKVKAS